MITSRRLRWSDNVDRIKEGRSALTGKPTGKRPLRRPRHRWEHSIKVDLKEIDINTRNWIYSVQDTGCYWRAPVYAAMNLRVM